jgi:hypothetical protein
MPGLSLPGAGRRIRWVRASTGKNDDRELVVDLGAVDGRAERPNGRSIDRVELGRPVQRQPRHRPRDSCRTGSFGVVIELSLRA